MNVIDTNIWIYRHDTGDPRKQTIAKNLISALRPLLLPWQVGCEFIAAARKLAPIGFDEANAWAALADMRTIAQSAPQLWWDAQSFQSRHVLSFWDALLVAACLNGGATVLYTEDMGSPRQIETLTLINPFANPPVGQPSTP